MHFMKKHSCIVLHCFALYRVLFKQSPVSRSGLSAKHQSQRSPVLFHLQRCPPNVSKRASVERERPRETSNLLQRNFLGIKLAQSWFIASSRPLPNSQSQFKRKDSCSNNFLSEASPLSCSVKEETLCRVSGSAGQKGQALSRGGTEVQDQVESG